MAKSSKNTKVDRRSFLNKGVRLSMLVGLGGLGGTLLSNSTSVEMTWQLDASKCVQCGQCATSCVVSPSAVKCMHVFDMCGYCDLCGGYFRPGAKNLTTAAENQLCPTAAIERKYIEKPYFEYHIESELCIGCGKCVKGCVSFGNGSMQLQVNHELCVNCNECSIARACPVDAFSRVPVTDPYLFNGIMKTD